MIVSHVFGEFFDPFVEELDIIWPEDAAMPCNQLPEHITSYRIGDVETLGRILWESNCDLDGRALVDL